MILAATGGGRAGVATPPHASGPQDGQVLAIGGGGGNGDKRNENLAATSPPTLPPQLPQDVATNTSMDSEVRIQLRQE